MHSQHHSIHKQVGFPISNREIINPNILQSVFTLDSHLPFSHLNLDFQMAAPRNFFITWVDATNPAMGLEFFPTKGSDELHEALKAYYPHCKNLQSRMQAAVIDFYLEQQTIDADFISSTHNTPEYLTSPVSTFASSMTTPLLQSSSSFSSAASPATVSSSSVLKQEELMNVWTLPSNPDAKIHKRRNMTADEKLAYKQKRIEGACADCKRRRRKCSHTSISSASSVSTSSASVRRKTKQVKRSVVAPNPASQPAFSHFEASFDSLFPGDDVLDPSLFNTDLDIAMPFEQSPVQDLAWSDDFINTFDFTHNVDLTKDFQLFGEAAPKINTFTQQASSRFDTYDNWFGSPSLSTSSSEPGGSLGGSINQSREQSPSQHSSGSLAHHSSSTGDSINNRRQPDEMQHHQARNHSSAQQSIRTLATSRESPDGTIRHKQSCESNQSHSRRFIIALAKSSSPTDETLNHKRQSVRSLQDPSQHQLLVQSQNSRVTNQAAEHSPQSCRLHSGGSTKPTTESICGYDHKTSSSSTTVGTDATLLHSGVISTSNASFANLLTQITQRLVSTTCQKQSKHQHGLLATINRTLASLWSW